MVDDVVKYELKTVRAIRGTESRAKAKWQKDGWEFVSEVNGPLQTQITFRRPKTKMSKPLIFALGGGALVLVVLAIVLGVIEKNGDSSDPAPVASATEAVPSEAPSTAPATQAETSASATDAPAQTASVETLTIENNADLAALLTGPESGAAVEDFAAKYRDSLIEFDANIAGMANHGDFETRYDILILAGDYSETSATGPYFQFRDVNTTNDLHFNGDIPDSIGQGDNLRVVARVVEFEAAQNLFLLEPVATEFR